MAMASLPTLMIPQILLFLVCAVVYHSTIQQQKQHTEVTASEAFMAAMGNTFDAGDVKEIFRVRIERNPSQSKLDHLGVSSWPKGSSVRCTRWGCGPSKIPWTFTASETMYLLEGRVKVYCDGHDEFFEIGAGDLIQFPKGMKITWDVIETVSKHYNLEK